MTTWKNAGELLADVRAARDRLVSGETAVEAAHVLLEAQLWGYHEGGESFRA